MLKPGTVRHSQCLVHPRCSEIPTGKQASRQIVTVVDAFDHTCPVTTAITRYLQADRSDRTARRRRPRPRPGIEVKRSLVHVQCPGPVIATAVERTAHQHCIFALTAVQDRCGGVQKPQALTLSPGSFYFYPCLELGQPKIRKVSIALSGHRESRANLDTLWLIFVDNSQVIEKDRPARLEPGPESVSPVFRLNGPGFISHTHDASADLVTCQVVAAPQLSGR